MNLLAIETSTNACSVALQVAERVIERHTVQPRVHTSILIPAIRELLGEANIRLDELDAVVLGNGPGSFIGMRIGASVAQGLAYSSGLGIVPVSSLAAVAAEVMLNDDAQWVAVAQDARMNEVYLGCYRRLDSGLPELIAEEAIVPAGKLALLQRAGDGWVAAGGAWQQYPELTSANSTVLRRIDSTELPRARHLLGLASAALFSRGTVPPEELQPAYLRQQVATPPGN